MAESKSSSGSKTETARGVVRWIVKSILFLLFFSAALFIPTGDLAWTQAWIYIALYGVNQLTLAFILSPDLLSERSKAQAGTKKWDVLLATAAALGMPLATYIVAGLDHLYHWSSDISGWSDIPMPLYIASIVLMVAGIVLTSWAMASNRFFSGLVRIQQDRAHHVVTEGPYRFVRHPGYVGGILHHLTAPLALGSLWALIPGGIGALLLVVRTALEDRTLQKELPGYAEYTRQTPHRLLPGIW